MFTIFLNLLIVQALNAPLEISFQKSSMINHFLPEDLLKATISIKQIKNKNE